MMHRRGKMGTAPASDAGDVQAMPLPTRRCHVFFFFFFFLRFHTELTLIRPKLGRIG